MSEAAWMCQNPNCGLIFQWNRFTGVASYRLLHKGVRRFLGIFKIRYTKEEDIEIPLCGDKRPQYCPECKSKEIDSLEG